MQDQLRGILILRGQERQDLPEAPGGQGKVDEDDDTRQEETRQAQEDLAESGAKRMAPLTFLHGDMSVPTHRF